MDPFSLPGLEEYASLAGQPKPSEVPFHAIASNLVHAVELMVRAGRHGMCDVPLAVVLTKTDALPANVYPFLGALRRPDPRDSDALHSLCREALCQLGGDASVRMLEQKFENVRYFACTATGRMPALRDASSFQPAGVEQPVLWLLGQLSPLSRPLKAQIPAHAQ